MKLVVSVNVTATVASNLGEEREGVNWDELKIGCQLVLWEFEGHTCDESSPTVEEEGEKEEEGEEGKLDGQIQGGRGFKQDVKHNQGH